MKVKKIAFGLLLVGAFTLIVAGISIASVERERSISALGDAAFLDDCQLQAVGDLLGFTPSRWVSGGPKDCDRPDPLDVQRDVSVAALACGGVSIASGGILLLIQKKRPELLSFPHFKQRIPKTKTHRDDLEVRLRSLDKLRQDGLLTESEFREQKQRLLHNQ